MWVGVNGIEGPSAGEFGLPRALLLVRGEAVLVSSLLCTTDDVDDLPNEQSFVTRMVLLDPQANRLQ
jgi:hypothetical protein